MEDEFSLKEYIRYALDQSNRETYEELKEEGYFTEDDKIVEDDE